MIHLNNMENIWYEELLEELDYPTEEQAQEYTDELEIMLVLAEYGYNKKNFDVIIHRSKELGYSKIETIKKIKEKG